MTLDLAATKKRFADAKPFEYPEADIEPVPKPDLAKVPAFWEPVAALGLKDAAATLDARTKTSVFEVFDCHLDVSDFAASEGAKDSLVVLSCSNLETPDMMDGVTLDAVVVLRPLAEPDAFCRLGEITQRSFLYDTPCLSMSDMIPDEAEIPQVSVKPIELVAEGRQALAVMFAGGSCSGGLHSTTIDLHLFGLEGSELVDYAGFMIDSNDYDGPCFPAEWETGKVSYGATFPKVITYVRAHECGGDEDAMEGCETKRCPKTEVTETWTYRDGKYAMTATTGTDRAPTTAKELMAEAHAQLGKKRYAQAIAALGRVLELDPDYPRARGELGWAHFLAGELEPARRFTETALAAATKPGSKAALQYNLGRIAEAEGKRDEALEHYRASLALRPNKSVQARLDGLTKGTR